MVGLTIPKMPVSFRQLASSMVPPSRTSGTVLGTFAMGGEGLAVEERLGSTKQYWLCLEVRYREGACSSM